jgi:hypothetical protein
VSAPVLIDGDTVGAVRQPQSHFPARRFFWFSRVHAAALDVALHLT